MEALILLSPEQLLFLFKKKKKTIQYILFSLSP